MKIDDLKRLAGEALERGALCDFTRERAIARALLAALEMREELYWITTNGGPVSGTRAAKAMRAIDEALSALGEKEKTDG